MTDSLTVNTTEGHKQVPTVQAHDTLKTLVLDHVVEVDSEVTKLWRGLAAVTRKNVITDVATFFAHPGTNTAAGLALASLSAFTGTVPAGDHVTLSLGGLAYAVASVAIAAIERWRSTPTTP